MSESDDFTTVTLPLDPGWADIREGVRRICDGFPNEYWVKLDHDAAYPTEFVRALTEAGYLAALIPEEYGGSGLPLSAACAVLETIHDSPCNAAACHAQMYTMGTVLRHGSEAQKRKYLPGIASRRAAAAGIRRHRADHRLRHHPAQDARREEGQRPLRRQRPEGVDQPRAALRPDAAARAHHAGRQGAEAVRGAVRVHRRPARGQGGRGPRHPQDRRHAEPQHLRGVLRQPGDPGREPDRPGGPGLPLHRRQHERRAHPDRLGEPGRRALLHPPRHRVRQGARRVRPAHRPEPGRGLPHRPRRTRRPPPPS